MQQRLLELLTLPTPMEWVRLVLVFAGLISCVAAGELIRKYFHWPPEVTRKFVHISVGILIFFAPMLFQSALIPLLLALVAILSMIVAVETGLLVGIHGTSRISYGTIFYPLSFFILIVFFWNRHPAIISLSMLGLALGDAAAAIVGESLRNPHEYRLTTDKKSIEGSITMFLTTFVSLFMGMIWLELPYMYQRGFLILTALAAAVGATAWEALSSKGLDNFTIPMSIALILYTFLVPTPMQDVTQLQVGMVLSLTIVLVSYFVHFLSASGSVATFLLASTIFGLGGWKWTLPILTFFILASLLSKAGKQKKNHIEHLFEKGSTRDWGQVAANGGVCGLLMIAQYIFPQFNLYPMYLGAGAAVTADTWGTEIGIFFQGKTISISRLTVVEPGTNGGVSMAGFMGGAVGAILTVLSAVPWVIAVHTLLSAVVAGLAGSLMDSLLGGTIQARYRCSVCGKMTERSKHCNTSTDFVTGARFVNNDTVNWICAMTGAGLAWILS
jgi:uncharacterized protein (TIGR00297 family)